VLHYSRSYDPFKGQGHEGPKVVKMADFKVSPELVMQAGMHIIKRLIVDCDTPRHCLHFV